MGWADDAGKELENKLENINAQLKRIDISLADTVRRCHRVETRIDLIVEAKRREVLDEMEARDAGRVDAKHIVPDLSVPASDTLETIIRESSVEVIGFEADRVQERPVAPGEDAGRTMRTRAWFVSVRTEFGDLRIEISGKEYERLQHMVTYPGSYPEPRLVLKL